MTLKQHIILDESWIRTKTKTKTIPTKLQRILLVIQKNVLVP